MSLAVMTALTLMSLVAVSVSLFLLHWTTSLTLMLPSLPEPATVLFISTSVKPERVKLSVAPVMSPPVAARVKPSGSISHVPLFPCVARVVTTVPSLMLTRPLEVSIKPPLPPSGALASRVPLTSVWPFSMSESSRMRPALFWRVRASITPLLVAVAILSASAALAVITTTPPSALRSPLFATRASTAP